MHDHDTQIVELSLQEAKNVVAFGEAIERLEKNPDFRKVILEGYFTKESQRLVFLSADSTLPPEEQNNVWHSIRAIGELRNYLVGKRQAAEVARKEVITFQEDLDERRRLEAEGEDEEGSNAE